MRAARRMPLIAPVGALAIDAEVIPDRWAVRLSRFGGFGCPRGPSCLRQQTAKMRSLASSVLRRVLWRLPRLLPWLPGLLLRLPSWLQRSAVRRLVRDLR